MRLHQKIATASGTVFTAEVLIAANSYDYTGKSDEYIR